MKATGDGVGDQDLEHLLAACRSGEPDRQLAAIDALARRQIVAGLAELGRLATEPPAVAVRASATDALGDFPDHASAVGPWLLTALGDADELVRSNAADALGRVRYRPAGAALAGTLTTDQSALVRAGAAESLGDLGDPTHAEAVAAAARNDPDEAVRAYAAASLGLLGGGDDAAGREMLAAEVSPWVRGELTGARYRTAGGGLDALLDSLDNADEELAERLFNALDDMVTRDPVRPRSTEAEAVAATVERIADRLPILHGHAGRIADRWRRRAGSASGD
jgi:HEAT repeat protein